MLAAFHPPNDVGKGGELLTLAAQQRISFEEGNHFLQEIPTSADHEHKCAVVGPTVVLPYRSAIQSAVDEVQDLLPTHVLVHPKLRYELPTDSRTGISLDRYVKAALAIDEARDVRIQPFLLIGRTCRIVTVHSVHVRPSVRFGCIGHDLLRRVAQDTYGFSSI